jgi:hypothetical protein
MKAKIAPKSARKISHGRNIGLPFVVILLILLICVPTFTILVIREGNHKFYDEIKSDNFNLNQTNRLIIRGDVVSLDLENRTMKLNFRVNGEGTYVSARRSKNLLTNSVTVEFNTHSVVFPRNQRQRTQHLSANLETGDLNNYPFDVYTFSDYEFQATTDNGTHVPLAIRLGGSLQGFVLSFSIKTVALKTGGNYNVASVIAYRSPTILIFTLIIFVLMWILTCGAVLLTYCSTKFGFFEPPLIAILSTFLFALPAVRNTLPGVPQIGCTFDVACLFWNMSLVSSCIIVLMFKFFYVKYNNKNETVFTQPHSPTYNVD